MNDIFRKNIWDMHRILTIMRDQYLFITLNIATSLKSGLKSCTGNDYNLS